MLTSLVSALAAEKTEGDEFAREMAARLDAHIRDLQTLRAWVMDSAKVRAEAIDALIGGGVPPEAPKPALRDRTADADA